MGRLCCQLIILQRIECSVTQNALLLGYSKKLRTRFGPRLGWTGRSIDDKGCSLSNGLMYLWKLYKQQAWHISSHGKWKKTTLTMQRLPMRYLGPFASCPLEGLIQSTQANNHTTCGYIQADSSSYHTPQLSKLLPCRVTLVAILRYPCFLSPSDPDVSCFVDIFLPHTHLEYYALTEIRCPW